MSNLINDIAVACRRTAKKKPAVRRAQDEEFEYGRSGSPEEMKEEDPNIELLNALYESLTDYDDEKGKSLVCELAKNLGLEDAVAFECEEHRHEMEMDKLPFEKEEESSEEEHHDFPEPEEE